MASARGILTRWPTVTAVVIALVLWEGLGRLRLTQFLPPLSTVVGSLGPMIRTGELQHNLRVSLLALAEGYGLAVVVGVSVGAAMGFSWRVKAILDPYVNAFLAAPSAAFVPLMVVFFGLGQGPVAATIFIFAAFVIIVSTETGVRGVDQSVLDMSHSFCAGRWLVFRRILLPGALPLIMSGLRQGAGRSIKGLVVGEALISLGGMGGALQQYGGMFQVPQVYALILVLVVISVIMTSTLRALERRASAGR
jgi:ABC-type nitrate/sulfonate/bicarbonate transport system permease component